MTILSTPGWQDYTLLDSGDGHRLERFGKHTLVRPDPEVLWQPKLPKLQWQEADAKYVQTGSFEGKWTKRTAIPDKWPIKYRDLTLWARLSSFKHLGFFPEQSLHWDWLKISIEKLKMKNNKFIPSVLNLFGYTGIATLVCAAAGAKVTHVDASRPALFWANENQIISRLQDKPIRWILDDAVKFAQREVRRGQKYDGIIMDPPTFGHGKGGKLWKFDRDFPNLLSNCQQLLKTNPSFILINTYNTSLSQVTLENIFRDFFTEGVIESGMLALKEKSAGRLLSTGNFLRYTDKKS